MNPRMPRWENGRDGPLCRLLSEARDGGVVVSKPAEYYGAPADGGANGIEPVFQP
jgi:hypothetical protein